MHAADVELYATTLPGLFVGPAIDLVIPASTLVHKVVCGTCTSVCLLYTSDAADE